ncbi:uncharacterized protein E0L32_002825 [Thyridium curvatum]|uniref:alpha-galactosidase n=1 Tax=Thyridium curvatum TaxID=1093900 RepID=A0A507BG29_9PEZI|nr:uncharacterized protein E0L32_002825 [Thyridium curvatum]TPX17724.1 hypothetical protein E0L32_002825 [Thyridium curvatum]
MSNTELVTIARPELARSPSAYERSDRSVSQRQQHYVESEPTDGRGVEQELSPIDGGAAAWKLLCAAFVFETLLWGFPLSFGVFQEHYSKIPEFADNRYIPVVGTIASGLGYLGAPVIMPFIQRYQRWQRQMIWIGWPICIIGLALGSFASTLEVLILTQGVAYGLGFLIFYYPILSMVNEYWVARRGMAYGVLCGASGVSGSFMPFVLQALLAKYGYKTTLRAMAIALALLTGPFIPFLRGRLPSSERASIPRMNWTFFRSPLFWVYSTSNLLQGFGYFFPSLYLPSFASSLGLGGKSGALLLALMSVCQVAGQFIFGMLSDRRVPLDVLACLSTIVAAIACLTMWRLATSLPVLILFAILYGLFGAGFTAIWARMSTAITDDVTTAPIVFSLLNFGKGIGNVLAGPIGGLLVSDLNTAGTPPSASYRWVIVFTGVCMLASACTVFLRHSKAIASIGVRPALDNHTSPRSAWHHLDVLTMHLPTTADPPITVSTYEQNLVFSLNGIGTSYQFHADHNSGDLVSSHFGGRIDQPLPASVTERGTYAHEDKLRRREFPELGRGDFRVPAVHVRHAQGHSASDFKYRSHSIVPGKPSLDSLPCTFGTEDEVQTLVVHMHDASSSVTADLSYSIFARHDAVVRSTRIINSGNHPITIEKLASLSFDLPMPARVGYDMVGLHGEWARERQRVRSRIRPGVQSFGSAQGVSSHWHNPFLAVCSGDAGETHGEIWGMALVYSGSHLCEVELSPRGGVRICMGMNPLCLSWQLAPGETLTSPECVVVYSESGFGYMSRNLHSLVCHNLARSNHARLPRPLLLNAWEGVYFNIDDKIMSEIAKHSAALGVKLLVMDDGWFGAKYPRVDDRAGLGDWVANPARFPEGLDAFARRIQIDHKLQLGLWVEPEMVSIRSALFEAHPEWVMDIRDHPATEIRNQLMLNLGLPEVQDYIIEAISALLRPGLISYIKWDCNRAITESPSPASHHRYMLGLYRVLEQLTQQYPDVFWEGCAAGGGRFDLGMLQYFCQVWTSDNTDALDRIHIQLGTSLAYPASSMGAHVSRSPNEETHRAASLSFRAHVAMMGAGFGVELDPRRLSDEERAELPGLLELSGRVNPIVVEGDMYRLNQAESRDGGGGDISNFPAVLFVSEDGARAVLFMFQIRLTMVQDRPTIRLQGLEPRAQYTLEGRGQYSGLTLMNAGVVPKFKKDLDSELVLISRVA